MLATHCPNCGKPAPVSLATPTFVHCRACGYRGRPRPEAEQRMVEAAEVLRLSNARNRQVAGLRLALVTSGKIVSGCLLTATIALTLLCGLPVLLVTLIVLPGILTGWLEKVSWVIAIVPFPLSIFVFGMGVVFIVRQALGRLEEGCAAVPPAAPGESASCHVCGAPLTMVGEAGVARCGFCQADNVVTARALDRARKRRDIIMEDYARGIGALTLKVHSVSALGAVGWAVAVAVTAAGSCTAANVYDEHLATITGPQGAKKLADAKPILSIVVDAQSVYWCGAHEVYAVPLQGGERRLLAAEPGSMATDRSLVGDGSHLFWMATTGEVRRVARTGGPLATIAKVEGVTGADLRMALDADSLYVTTRRSLVRVPKAGGAPAILTETQRATQEVAVDDTHVYWFEERVAPGRPRFLQRISKSGGAVTTLYSQDSISSTVRPALDETSIYYVANYGNAINRQPKAGGNPSRIATSEETEIEHLALDGGWVYFATRYDSLGCGGTAYGAIRRVPKGGGKIEELTSGLKTPAALALDGTSVYWGDLFRETLMRMPKRR